uniref:Uncharacterized protein isoform X6 n=1 Tax=Pogona vitticeps TaxID=103695 RepID=A0ABM5EI89_9SAUR
MEVGGPEDSLSTTQLGPLTSTPRESAPPLPPTDLPSQTDSSTSISSESSGEDWLIKICCPGARHRYCRHAKKKKQISQHQKTGFLRSLDKEDGITKSAEGMPITSYQTPTGVLRQESSDLQWLIRLRCPRTQMEQIPHLKQCLPAASSSLSRSPSKTCQSSPSERAKTSESWLTPKHFSVVQASSAPGSPVSLCVLLPPFHPLFEFPIPSDSSYFPSFLPPFPFSILSVSLSTSPIIVLPSILLPPSVPSHFFHLLPPFPPYLHSPSLFVHSPFLQMSPSELASSSSYPPFPLPTPSLPSASPPSSSSTPQTPGPFKEPPASEQESFHDFSAYHSHNPFFLPIPPSVQSCRRYQARQKNSDSVKYS